MSVESTEVMERALRLSSGERAIIVQELPDSLYRPVPERETLWAAEARDRLLAHDAGELPAIPEEEVFAEWDDA